MGFSSPSLALSHRAYKGHETRAANAKRMDLADKIVLAIIDRVSTDIIRPGPDEAERECYVVAQELRDHSAVLRELVARILKVEDDEGG